MKILALDPASTTGVAIGDASGDPLCHTERLGTTGKHGARFLQSQITLSRLIKQHRPDVIVLESAIATGVKGGEERAQLAMGLRACFMAVAFKFGLPVEEYAVQSIRKHFIGHGNMKRTEAKAATIARCKQLGWDVANDNEADAAAAWDYARGMLKPQYAIKSTPGLFQADQK